jgi:hypothetical protein
VATPTNQQTAAPPPPASTDLSPVTGISESSYCRQFPARGVKHQKAFLQKVRQKLFTKKLRVPFIPFIRFIACLAVSQKYHKHIVQKIRNKTKGSHTNLKKKKKR